MTKSLLTPNQNKFFKFFQRCEPLHKNFYFSGGTALSEFYLRHRFSEDLDFFSEQEFEVTSLSQFLQTNKEKFEAKQIRYIQSFNRNLFFAAYADGSQLKLEFTYYPFPRLKKGKKIGNLQIDSVLDIAVNKAFTLTQQVRGRDFFDIFALAQKYNYEFADLLKKARQKFDYPINYLQLGKNLLKVTEFLDDPILVKEIDKKLVEEYFLRLVKDLNLLTPSSYGGGGSQGQAGLL